MPALRRAAGTTLGFDSSPSTRYCDRRRPNVLQSRVRAIGRIGARTMVRTLLALGAAFSAFTSVAAAQPVYVEQRPLRYERPAPPPYGAPGQFEPAFCQRWCPADSSPCDPPYFKTADGRCSPRTRF